MGLLTDPSAGQSGVVKLLTKIYPVFCILLYLGGVIYFGCLAHRKFNGATYFSENALLPGLVTSEFREDHSADQFYHELIDEMKKYDNSIPYPWILAKFRQIGLDSYTHNFTLNYPLGDAQKFSGKNVYGILRAPRASSTEALVLSVPYRPPLSVHETTAPSLAIMLAFAKFANSEKYWAKDIIFLVTEHEQLGIQAWLEAYHGVNCGKSGVLVSGDMKGRAGAIQAAINLEFHTTEISSIDIKIEGLNGQLPNLDLFNLASKMCGREGISYTFKGRPVKHIQNNDFEDWKYAFKTMMMMATTQATGVPNGNHGLYFRFGIQALTLESGSHHRYGFKFLTMGRIIEAVFRSLNNLLERFHQSFFFYLLSASDRYISIGLYIPAIGALVAVLFVKAYAKWCQMHKDEDLKSKKTDNSLRPEVEELSDVEIEKQKALANLNDKQWEDRLLHDTPHVPIEKQVFYGHIALVIVTIHGLGFVLKDIVPFYATKYGVQEGYTTEMSAYLGFAIVSLLMMVFPLFIRRPNHRSMIMLEIIALIELGTIFMCIAMYNISLAMFSAVIYVPFALIMCPIRCRYASVVQKFFWILLHPFILANIVVTIFTFFAFSNDTLQENLSKGLFATQQALVYSIVDSIVYGNWLFSVICVAVTPAWFLFWHLSFYVPTEQERTTKNKKNVKKEKTE